MLNNENKVKPLFKKRFLLYSLLIVCSQNRSMRRENSFIVSMLMDYESVKRGNNIGRIVAVH